MKKSDWNESILGQPSYHLFQTEEWTELKSAYGWKPVKLSLANGFEPHTTAVVLERSIALAAHLVNAKVLYVPRGPLVDWNNITQSEIVLGELERISKERKAIFIKIDPEVLIGKGIPGGEYDYPDATGEAVTRLLKSRGWIYSKEQIQFKNSVWLNLKVTEEDLLSRMKQKTRYNIRLAEKKGVKIRRGEKNDLDSLFQLYAQTSLRDGFTIRGKQYYLDVWNKFMDAGMAVPLIAEYEGILLAGIFLFWLGKKAWYLYGMSSDQYRDFMPNYALQWTAIQQARKLGCEVYDLWGAPDTFNGKDRMSGVFRFKQGLGGEVIRMIGAWDYPSNRSYYFGYSKILPVIMSVMRKLGKNATTKEAGG